MSETLLSPSGIKLFGRVAHELHLLKVAKAWKGAVKVVDAVYGKKGDVSALAKLARTTAEKLTTANERLGGFSAAEAAFEYAHEHSGQVDDPKGTDRKYDSDSVYAAAKSRSKVFTYIAGNPREYNPPNEDLREDRPYPSGANNFLRRQLKAPGARLARIFGFSYEGHYYDLPKPAMFLVHGPGEPVTVSRHEPRSSLETSGVVAREWEFSADARTADPELRRWDYDKGDFSIRLDIETGPLEQILLAACLRGGPSYASGSDLRTSGSDLRISGSDLRGSGSDLRISGSDRRRR